MIRESGAVDEKAQQRFLAGVMHQNTVDVLGGVAEEQQDFRTKK